MADSSRSTNNGSPALVHLYAPANDAILKKVSHMFEKMDADRNKKITRTEALNHFKAFNKVNTNAMFNEIDLNNDSEITIDEWKGFWENLLQTGIYKPEEIESELETLLRGEAWVDWNDNRHSGWGTRCWTSARWCPRRSWTSTRSR